MKLRLFAAFFALVPLAAGAQDAPVKFYYRFDAPGANVWLADNAIHQALEQPGLVLEPAYGPNLLIVTISGPIERDKGDAPKGFRFTLGYVRSDDRLGESREECRTDKMADCAAQIANDIKSAAAIHP